MPPTVEDRLRDILEAIGEIEGMLAGHDLALFTVATERYFEVICEAARRLTDEVKRDALNIEWQKMVDFGNRLRHAYHATDVRVVWEIIQDHPPPLKALVERRIRASN